MSTPIWLRSNDRYEVLARLDHESGAFSVVNVRDLGLGSPTVCDGHFALLGGRFVGLYRHHDALFLRLGSMLLEMTPEVVVEVSGALDGRTLVVHRGGVEIATHQYTLSPEEAYPHDLTPFQDAEEIDFGLFISNSSKSQERKDVLLGKDE